MHGSAWIVAAALVFLAVSAVAADQEWPVYLGDRSNTHFSPLGQINRENVKQLEVAWVCHVGDVRPNRSQMECTPLMVDGVLYSTTPGLRAIALNAATGEELWRFTPLPEGEMAEVAPVGVNRAVVYWADGSDRRILYVAGHYLYSLDARTGKPVPSFGTNGMVELRDGLGRDVSRLYITATSPGIVFSNLFILGSRVAEGPGPAAPGHLRAYDIRTGAIVWVFHTIPQPGEFGYDTWPPDAWKFIGGVNCWPGMALDEKRGILYAPIGSASFDFWGGNRLGADLFANCLVALNAATGKRLWHFQMVHHDLLDRDPPAPPTLVTIRHNGQNVDAVAEVTKSGHVFIFNRETGESLFPIEEKQVPRSDLDGEMAWPTQPFPTKPAPFVRQLFTADEITDITPESHRNVLENFVRLRPHAVFMPPSREGTIIFPGFDGGAEWGGAAVDPKSGILYVNANEMPWVLTMIDAKPTDGSALSSGQLIYRQLCAACHGLDRKGDAGRAFPSLLDVGRKYRSEQITDLLGIGKGMMPSFGFLSEPQRKAVTDFLVGESLGIHDDSRQREVDTDVLGGEPYTHTGYLRWLDLHGYPAIKPPWGTLSAIDLNTGEYVWRTTLGEYPSLKARGIPPTGIENYGGPVLTASGLIFIAASGDEMMHAFDQKTGELLWQAKLPAGGYATPSTYMLRGRQYVVIACGGGKARTKSGDAYVAFALPESH
jgi:quinoprotein glucose dehydrogenase